MYCPYCGKEFTEIDKFCSFCGASLDGIPGTGVGEVHEAEPVPSVEAKEKGPPPAGVVAPKPPPYTSVPPATAAQPPVGAKKRFPVWLLILILVLVVVIAGGVVAGVLLTRSGTKLVAEIESVNLALYGGKKVDLEEVPLDKDLVLKVKYKAQFPDSGTGTITVTAEDSEGTEIDENIGKCKSREGQQGFEWEFYLPDYLAGSSVEMKVVLEVKDGSNKVSDDKELRLTVEGSVNGSTTDDDNGDTGDDQVEAARRLAIQQQGAAMSAVAELTGLGIDTSGLDQLLQQAQYLIDNGTTVEELAGETDSAVYYANSVINECQKRKDAYLVEQDIANCQQIMLDYAKANSVDLTNFYLEGFTINDSHTAAEATVVATITASGDGDYAGQEMRSGIRAEKQDGQWVVTYFGTG